MTFEHCDLMLRGSTRAAIGRGALFRPDWRIESFQARTAHFLGAFLG